MACLPPRMQRSIHSICILSCGWILAVFCSAGSSYAQDWPLARGDSHSTGFAAGSIADEPTLLWEYSTEKTAFEGSPIIAAGSVFIGDADGTIHAIHLSSGKAAWTLKTKNGFLSAGAYRDGKLVFGDFDGKVYCLNATNSEKLWERELDQPIASGGNFFEDLVLLTSESGSMFALELSNGEIKWQYETGDQLRSGPTLWKHYALLGGCDGKLHKIDLKKGDATDSGLPLDGPTGSTPGVINDVVVIPNQAGQVFGFHLPTGERLWAFADSERSQEIRSSPAIIGSFKESEKPSGIAVITTRNRRVLGLNLADGSIVWEAILKKRSDSSAVICGGRAWVGATDGKLYAIDLKSGKESWSYQVNGGLIASPAISDGKLIIATDKGSVLCFGTKGNGG